MSLPHQFKSYEPILDIINMWGKLIFITCFKSYEPILDIINMLKIWVYLTSLSLMNRY